MSSTDPNKPKLIQNGKRLDGRNFTDLRPLKITAGVLKQADGSAMIEWGKNRIIAAVYGPREVIPKFLTDQRKAIITARYTMAPFSSLEEHGRSGPNRRSIEISKVAKHVFENVVVVNKFPKTAIEIYMDVVQSDGGTRIAAITAASVALADAGIPLKDIVSGVAVGKVDGQLVVDLDKLEDNYGESDAAVIVSPRTGEILLFQMEGMLAPEEVKKTARLASEAALKIRELQVEALKEKYAQVASELGEQIS